MQGGGGEGTSTDAPTTKCGIPVSVVMMHFCLSDFSLNFVRLKMGFPIPKKGIL